MRGWCGRTRAISRKTVRPPTPESKMPMGAGEAGDEAGTRDEGRGEAERERFFVVTRLCLVPRPSSLLLTLVPVTRRHGAAAFAFAVVLLDFFVQVRAGGIDGLGGLRDVPAVLAELGEDEGL